MDQALPPLFVRAGQRSYVDYCAEGGRSLGTRLVILFDPGLRHSAVSRFEAMIEDRDNRGAVIEDRGAMIEDRSRIAVAVQ